MTDQFVRLDELAEHPDNLFASWQLPLPEYSGAENLALNVTAANRIAHLGSLLEVQFRPGRQQAEEQPAVGGMGNDGTATAAATLSMARRRQRANIHLDSLYNDGDEVPFFRRATIGIDLDPITERLSRQQQLRQPGAWAKQLNAVAWRGLRQAALKNITEINRNDGFDDLHGLMWGMGFNVIYNTAFLRTPSEWVTSTVLGATVSLSTISLVNLGAMFIQGARAGLPLNAVPYHVLPFAADRRARIHAAALRRRQLIRHLPDAPEA